MANKDEVVAKMQSLKGEIEQAVSEMPEEAWEQGVYEGGWNARQVLCHMASMSGVVGFVLGIARMPASPSLGASFDENAFNARLVAAREGKSNADLLGEIKSNFERDISALRAAPDDLLGTDFRAPWDVEGELGDVIVMSLEEHLGTHLADLRSAAP